jgi:toxin secretion/phage lysis holin
MEKHVLNWIIAGLGVLGTWLFGGWDLALKILVAFMVTDYITGLFYAFTVKTIDSKVGFKGIAKKSAILAILIVGTLLDRLIQDKTFFFRTLVCYFYISNEGISILENCGKMGLKAPKKLMDTLEQLK